MQLSPTFHIDLEQYLALAVGDCHLLFDRCNYDQSFKWNLPGRKRKFVSHKSAQHNLKSRAIFFY